MSHLKEMGVVFSVPNKEEFPQAIYTFFMTLHYTFEVDWHSKLFESYSKDDNFAKKLTDALRVSVSKDSLCDTCWRVVPKYLAKKDPDDFRLFEPRISPEAWHFREASIAIEEFSRKYPEAKLDFWVNSETVAEYFNDVLTSFDLYDNGIAYLKKQCGLSGKYVYHQREALWNKLFSEYFSEEELDRALRENLEKGHIKF